MKTEFIYFLICLLIPRLFTQWKDDTVLTLKSVSFTIIVEIVLLIPLFYSPHSFIILFFFLVTYHGFQFFLNRIFVKNKKDDSIKTIYLERIIEFVFIIFVGSFVFGIFLKDTGLNSYISEVIAFITENNVLFINYDPLFSKRMIVYIFGLLLVTNEVNNLIRMDFEFF